MLRIRSEPPPRAHGLVGLTSARSARGPCVHLPRPQTRAPLCCLPLCNLSVLRPGSAPHAHSVQPPVTRGMAVPVHSGHPQISAPSTTPLALVATPLPGHTAHRGQRGLAGVLAPRGPRCVHLPLRSWLISSASHGHWLLLPSHAEPRPVHSRSGQVQAPEGCVPVGPRYPPGRPGRDVRTWAVNQPVESRVHSAASWLPGGGFLGLQCGSRGRSTALIRKVQAGPSALPLSRLCLGCVLQAASEGTVCIYSG